MYRRLVMFSLAVCAVAVIALVVPLGLAARDILRTEEIGEVADRARLAADAWQVAWHAAGGEKSTSRPDITIPPGDGRVTLIVPDGEQIGPPAPEAARPVIEAARTGHSSAMDTGTEAYASAPALLDEEIGVVLVSISPAELSEGLAPRLWGLALLSATLLSLAGLASWVLARRTVAPLRALAATAHTLADGDLTARAVPTTVPEVGDVGTALNRLAGRVQELLAEERENAAELAHQLRTPLTVLAIDIDGVTDPETRDRLADDVLALQKSVDEIIVSARRSDREGLRARSDVTDVVAERIAFWRVLAEDQHRPLRSGLAPGPLWVRLTPDDLAAATDILLQNVFSHTPEGTGFEVRVTAEENGFVAVRVADRGPGFPTGSTGSRAETAARRGSRVRAPGSTGLGLAIAERLAIASGGRLVTENGPDSGAIVTLTLGPAAE